MPQTLFAVGAIITASAGLIASVVAARRSGRTERHTRTPNGQGLGVMIENQGKQLEVLMGQVHDQSKRLDAQGREIGAIGASLTALAEAFEDHRDREG